MAYLRTGKLYDNPIFIIKALVSLRKPATANTVTFRAARMASVSNKEMHPLVNQFLTYGVRMGFLLQLDDGRYCVNKDVTDALRKSTHSNVPESDTDNSATLTISPRSIEPCLGWAPGHVSRSFPRTRSTSQVRFCECSKRNSVYKKKRRTGWVPRRVDRSAKLFCQLLREGIYGGPEEHGKRGLRVSKRLLQKKSTN